MLSVFAELSGPAFIARTHNFVLLILFRAHKYGAALVSMEVLLAMDLHCCVFCLSEKPLGMDIGHWTVQTQHLYTFVPIETASVPIEATSCTKSGDKSVPIIEAASVLLKVLTDHSN